MRFINTAYYHLLLVLFLVFLFYRFRTKMAAFSGIPIVVSGLLAVKQRIDILKETDQNCKYLYPLLENLIPILQRFTGEDAPLIIRPLEEVVKELEELFISFELPSMKERMKQFIAQPAKTRKLDSICKKLTVALLSMLTCMLQNNLGITNDLKTAITHIYEGKHIVNCLPVLLLSDIWLCGLCPTVTTQAYKPALQGI